MKYSRLFLLAALFCSGLFAADAVPAPRPIDVKNYLIRMEIDPSRNPTSFEAETEVTFESVQPIDKFSLDINELDISKVAMTKPVPQLLKFKIADDKKSVEITLPGIMRPKKEKWTVLLHYTGKIREAHEGLFKVFDPDDASRGAILVTQFESESARAFYPCNDQPADKATSEMEITVPAKYEVLSNGKRESDRPARKGWHVVHWKLDKPHSTYLVSLAIGRFAPSTASANGTPVSVWTGPNQTERAKYALEGAQQGIVFYERYLGVKYPWPKYAIVSVPTFLWGGMENTSSTHQNQNRTLLHDPQSELEKTQIFALGAHELAHQWFGDYVTMAGWDNVWLNESFASFMEMEASKDHFKNDHAEIETVASAWDSYFRQDDGPRSHAIVEKNGSADGGFDDINYTKGEQVLRMLRSWIGDAAFRKGLEFYLKSHPYRNATYQDVFSEWQKASGKNLAAFRDSWLLQRGYPVVTYSGQWDAATKTYQLSLDQHSNHAEDKAVFQLPLPVVFHRKSAPAYDKPILVEFGKDKQLEKVALPDAPEWVTVNPGAAVLARLVPGDNMKDMVSVQALRDPDSIARVWAANELTAPLRDGKSMSTEDRKAVIQVLTKDPSPYVRLAVLDFFQKMKARWVPADIGETVWGLAQEVQAPAFEKSPGYTADTHGARLWRAELLAALGRVDKGDVQPWLKGLLARKDLALDDLGRGAFAVAALGSDASISVLKDTLKRHSARGYAYQFAVQYAFGACENPKAALEIAEIAKNSGSDFMGKIGNPIRDNQVLKNSREWAQFVQDFILNDARFGDEVKSRLLETIEEVKSDSVKTVLETIQKQSKSPRLQEDSKKILGKNFS